MTTKIIVKPYKTTMKHVESSIKVYFTREYSAFKFIQGNRMLDELKIKRIIQDIKWGNNMLAAFPILVDDQLNIIDGQHRYYAAMKTKNNIYYIIYEPVAIQQIATMNSRQKGWKMIDYLDCYVSTGNNDYQILKEFEDTYDTGIGIAMLLLSGSYDVKSYKEGSFKVYDLNRANEIATCLNIFNNTMLRRKTDFARAILKIYLAGIIDWEVMKNKYNTSGIQITLAPNDKMYIQQLQHIYNYRNQKIQHII